MYVKKTVECCGEIEVTKFHGGMFGNHSGRKPKNECAKTCRRVEKNNFRMTARNLYNLFRENFSEGDSHLSLTYAKGTMSEVKAANKEVTKFLRRLRDWSKKNDVVCKYIWNTDVSESGKIHHHIVLPKEIPIHIVSKLWQRGKVIFNNALFPNNDFYGLAEYFIDPTHKGTLPDIHAPGGKRYKCSKNLRRPKTTYEIIRAERWKPEPQAPKGYCIKPDSLYNSIDERSGYPYQHYILIKQSKRRF